uniref:DUF2029 domain-containing protein n=1 Tax=Thermorudis peleae TaxID=1382356 RepID=A0A831TG60_9BACT
MIGDTPRLSIRQRILLALVIGLASTVLCYYNLVQRDQLASDFTWPWRGAMRLLNGQNPYDDPKLSPLFPYPFDAPLYYPMPALLVALPFTALPAELAGALFFGISSGLLAYGISRSGLHHLPLFLSAPFYVAAVVAQWSPLITAAAFLPALLPFAFAKPNVGIPIVLSFPHRRGLILSAFVLGLSLLIMPRWPLEWLENVTTSHHQYRIPLTVLPGPLLLLALVRWQRPAARLLLLFSLIPQRLWFYDQLSLWLLARSARESMLLSAASWVGYWGWRLLPDGDLRLGTSPETAAPWVVACIYLPALLVVLFREPSRRVLRARWRVTPLIDRKQLRVSDPAEYHRSRSIVDYDVPWIAP